MSVYEQSRHLTATEIIQVEIDDAGNEREVLRYLDNDRKIWRPEDFTDNISIRALADETPDKMTNRLYGNSAAYWVVCDFNDFVANDPFIVFDGTEILTMPSVEVFNTVILAGAE